MRLLIDTLIAVMLVALLGGLLWSRQQERRERADVEAVRGALATLADQAAYHGALGHISNSPAGYPVHMMPDWFGEALPVNALLSAEHPWIDLAPPGDTAAHPPDPIATSESQAGFWYNPNLGVFRARVPESESDRHALEAYNEVNRSALSELPERDAMRAPQAYHPLDATTRSAAGDFVKTYLAGRVGEGHASGDLSPEDDETVVIDWVSGEPGRAPLTIHDYPESWNLPPARTAADPDAEGGDDADAAQGEASRHEPSGADRAEGEGRRPTLSDLLGDPR